MSIIHVAQGPSEITGRRPLAGASDARVALPTATELLADVEKKLASSLDYEDVIRAVASLAVPAFADWSVLDLAPAPSTTARAAVVHGDPAKAALASELEQLLVSRASWGREARPGWTGRPEIVDGRLESWLAEHATADGRLGGVVAELGAGSAMCVPLMAHGSLIGLLTVVSAAPERYRPSDLALAAALGQRAATAIDHARRFRLAQLETTARNELWAMASHDLKNAVTTVLVRSSLLLAAADSPDQRHHLESIERTARHMQRLVGDLLDSARLHSGEVALACTPQSVDDLLGEILDRFAPVAEDRQVRLSGEVEPGLPRMLCDREQLLRLLSNLVDNAVKFTAPGGSVVVRAERSPGGIRVAVSDTGMGIDESQLPHVFERYWQRDRSARGTGLGLYIARQIVSAHRGTIGVESKAGAGTRFFFTIPASE